MLRRAFHAESVDDDSGKRQIDQDVAQAPASLLRDFSRFKKKISDAGQKKHLQDLTRQNPYNSHVFLSLRFLPRVFFRAGQFILFFTMVSAIRFFFSSTLTTQTFTTSPTFTTSLGWRMNFSAMREICTSPS